LPAAIVAESTVGASANTLGGQVNVAAAAAGGNVIRSGTAQGGTANSITLDSGASSVNGDYVGTIVVAGNQSPTIIGYNGTTKVATVNIPWVVTPTDETLFAIIPAPEPVLTPVQITLNQTVASNGQIVPGKTLYVQRGFTPMDWQWTGSYVFQGAPKVSLWIPGANPPDGTGNAEVANFPITGTLSGGNTTATFDPAASLFTGLAIGTYQLTLGDDLGGGVVYDVAQCLVEVVDAGPVP
jgi:hypothetical protein